MQQDRCAGERCQLRRGVDVVVVPVRAQDGHDAAPGDRLGDGSRIVRSIDDKDLVVIADQPHVVVDVPRSPVEREGAGGDDLVDAGCHGGAPCRKGRPHAARLSVSRHPMKFASMNFAATG